jgi:LuxR family maltose regulon positive regulatory protein
MAVLSIPIGTKQCVPRLPDPWLVRPRLNQRCARVVPGEAMLIAAFAGAGKTTLLADWFTNDCAAAERAWLTVDARDNAPGRLSAQLARTLGADEALEDLDGRLCSDQLVLDRVFEYLTKRELPTVLVLDDVHELTSRPALAALSHLLVALPPTLAVFLAARADPPLPFARMQVEGRLHQLRAADLALTHAEMADLFERHDVVLSDADVESLRQRTGGWAGVSRLAALALAARVDHDDVVENIVQADAVIADYLVREVLDRQPAEMRRFLLRTSLARPLTEQLARELTGEADARDLLVQLERSGLLVCHRDDAGETYRFHALFGELLRARYRHDEPELAASLLARAAHWYVEHDMPAEAEQHAYDAGNLDLAGQLSCQRFVREALSGTWMHPAEVPVASADAARIPQLALVAAANAVAVLDQRSAQMWRSRLEAMQPLADAKDDWLRAARLLFDVAYGRAFGTDARALESCSALLDADLGSETAALHALARLRQADLLLDRDDEGEEATLRALLDARWRAGRIAARWIVDEADVLLALIAAVRGRLDSCEVLLENIPPRGDEDPVADTRALARALCDAQHGRLNGARWALDARADSELAPRAVRIGIEVAIGQLDARDRAQPYADPATDHPFGRLVGVAFGAIDGARARPESEVAQARLLLAKHRDEQALRVLDPLLEKSRPFEQLRTQVEAAILAAVAADRLDDHDRALALLRRALALAAPVDLRAPFQANVGLLAAMIDRYSWQLAGTSAYAAELLDDLHPDEFPVFVEPLTARERAVLEYLPTMMTNTEIARQLLVSVNTVKTHLKAVYRKLGVARRREAVLRARQLEIL